MVIYGTSCIAETVYMREREGAKERERERDVRILNKKMGFQPASKTLNAFRFPICCLEKYNSGVLFVCCVLFCCYCYCKVIFVV